MNDNYVKIIHRNDDNSISSQACQFDDGEIYLNETLTSPNKLAAMQDEITRLKAELAKCQKLCAVCGGSGVNPGHIDLIMEDGYFEIMDAKNKPEFTFTRQPDSGDFTLEVE